MTRIRHNFTDEQFVQAWMKIYKKGGNMVDVGKELGCSDSWVSTLSRRFRKQGVKIPYLNHAYNSKRMAKNPESLNKLIEADIEQEE